MSTSTTTTHLPRATPLNFHLLPKSKHDTGAIDTLENLDPSEWTQLLLVAPDKPSVSASPPIPAIDTYDGLLIWLQDPNWPIASPTIKLLLSLVNSVEPATREVHGGMVIKTMERLFKESEDWAWCYSVLGNVVAKIEDKVWMRSMLGDSLKGLRERVPEGEEKDWGFGEVIAECLGECTHAHYQSFLTYSSDGKHLPNNAQLTALSPSSWTHLILMPRSITLSTSPPIDNASGLLTWLQDITWPVAHPTANLLLWLVDEPCKREEHGQVLADALDLLLKESEDWAWCYWVLVYVVLEVDRVWVGSVLGSGLRGFRERAGEEMKREWGFEMVVAECLGEYEGGEG